MEKLADDRGDLDGDVVDVVAVDELANALEAPVRFGVAEDGLAEQVDVELVAVAAQLLQGAAETAGRRVDDEVPDHAAQHTPGDGHDGPRQEGREAAAEPDEEPQIPGQESRDALTELLEVAGGDAQVVGASDAVDEAEGELEPEGVLQQPSEARGARVGLDVLGLTEPVPHEPHGGVGERGGGRRGRAVETHSLSLRPRVVQEKR